MEKINIAELLKDCPKGMELDCTMYDNCTYAGIEDVGYIDILINTPSGRIRLTKEGCYIRHDDNAKCVIFPKGKTTWEGFHRPFKDGDILATNDGSFIAIIKKNGGKYYCCCHKNGNYFITDYSGWFDRFATEEEKQKLFDAIKANGYRWNAETKTLEKLVEPKFKVGDRVKYRSGEIVYRIVQITEDSYVFDNLSSIPISIEHMYNLVPNKFDITTLKAFDKVLYRMHHNDTWLAGFYNVCIKNKNFVIGLSAVPYCIPYENNQHLLGTTNDCDDFYKTWEK